MNTIEHKASFDIEQSIEKVFPLFSAEGEKLWVPGWDYENIMGTTDLSEDYVFFTKTHDHASTEAIWLVKRYKPKSHFIQFYKIEPEDKVGIITVQCTQLIPEATQVQVTYKYVGLSKKGENFITEFTFPKYESFLAEWKKSLDAYFKSRSIHP